MAHGLVGIMKFPIPFLFIEYQMWLLCSVFVFPQAFHGRVFIGFQMAYILLSTLFLGDSVAANSIESLHSII